MQFCLLPMSSFSTDSSIHCEFSPLPVPSLSPVRLDMFTREFRGESDSDRSQGSVTRKRRHGLYFPRPPVLCPRPCSHLNQLAPSKARSIPCMRWKGSSDVSDGSADSSRQQTPCLPWPTSSQDVRQCTGRTKHEGSDPCTTDMFCETTAAAIGARVDAESGIYDSNSEDPLFADSLNSHLTLSKGPSKCHLKEQSTVSEASTNQSYYWHSFFKENLLDKSFPRPYFRQTKPGLCTRLQSYKDVRLGVGERWAVQEGSLVVCVDPSYTHFDRKEGFLDEFELASGDFYVVCRLYADLWALCIKLSFDSRTGSYFHGKPGDSVNLGFLPLCAVTLAANFGAFVQRTSRYTSYPSSEIKHPGNGLPVIPPERSHSVNASKQIFHGSRIRIQLPVPDPGAYRNLSLDDAGADFIPLDSTLEQLFSKFGGWRERAHQLRSRVSLPNIRHGGSSEQRAGVDSPVLAPGKALRSSVEMQGSELPRVQDIQLLVGVPSPPSHGCRCLVGMPARGTRQGRDLRGLILRGSEKLRSSFRNSSDL